MIDLIRYVGFQRICESVPRYAQPVPALARNVYTLRLRCTFIAIKHIGPKSYGKISNKSKEKPECAT